VVIKYYKKLAWYPPAESKIPLHAILGAFFSSKGNFEKTLCNYLQVKHCVLGNSGRALLYILLERLGVRRMYPKAIADEETIKPYLVDQEASTPGALEIAQNLLTLPTHKGITANLAKEIAQKVNDIRI
jgi:dTDP-4-amino-4,6-dideoxygalactose transaminase